MGFNREDFSRIREEYSKKYLKAREAAEARRREVWARVPEVVALDGELSLTASRIMQALPFSDSEARISRIKQDNEELLAKRRALLVSNGYDADFTDIKYECDKCGDTGYVDTKMCSCMRRSLVMAGYRSSGIAELMRTQSFDNFSLDYYANRADMQRVVTGLRNFAESFDGETYRNFLFLGGTGLGKTHLSTSIAKAVIDRGYDVKYVSACGMISEFEDKRFGFGNTREAANTDRYYEADLLIIDDFGTEISNQFTVSCIYDIINTRMISAKPTIINTNLNKSEISERYGDRITSRLFGEYLPIIFNGTDIREQKIRGKRV